MGIIVFLIVLAILFVVGLVCVFALPSTVKEEKDDGRYNTKIVERKTHYKTFAGIATLVIALIAGFTVLGGSYNRIPARNLGVVTSFGKVTGEILEPGAHWLAPWKSVSTIDTTNQNLKMVGDKGSNDKDDNWIPWVEVRLGNQTIAHVDVTILWHINNSAADVTALYNANKHGNTQILDRVRDTVLEVQAKHALSLVYNQYDPLAGINSTQSTTKNYDDLEKQVLAELNSKIPGITIVSLIINNNWYDNTTQDQLNKYAQALAAQRIAEQQAKVNQAVVDANNILANAASSKDPGAQYQQCLQLLRDLASEGKLGDLPPNTLTCGNGSNGSVIVQNK